MIKSPIYYILIFICRDIWRDFYSYSNTLHLKLWAVNARKWNWNGIDLLDQICWLLLITIYTTLKACALSKFKITYYTHDSYRAI